MPSISQEKRKELTDELSEAEHNGESGVCNWCGADSENISKERSVHISDLKHQIYSCSECGHLTATYYWNGTVWRAAISTRTNVGTTYHMVAGKPKE